MPSGRFVPISLEDEYKKDTGITPKDIENLRTWLCTQNHLPGEHITDLELILAYHCCERDPEATRKLIDTHYTLKTSFADLFKDRVMDERIEKVLNIMLLTPLPRRTKEGYAVYYTRLIDYDPQNFVHVDSLRTMLMSLEIWQHEEGTWPGLVIISDLAGMNFGHFYRLQWSALQHYSMFVQEAFLAKLKQVHVLNAPWFFDKMMSMVKPFIKQALFDLLHIHTVGSDGIGQFYPIEALPVESGGQWKSIEESKGDVIAKFRASSQLFEEESKRRVIEMNRAAKKTSGLFRGWSFR